MLTRNPLTASHQQNRTLWASRFLGCMVLITTVGSNLQAAVAEANQEPSFASEMDQAQALTSEWREASLREAIIKYRAARMRSQAARHYELAAQATQKAGDVYFILSEYRNALQQYSEARSLWRRARNRPSEMRALNLVGYVHIYLGKSETALHLVSQALGYFRRINDLPGFDPRFEAEAQNCAGETNYSLSRFRRSIEYFEQALALWTAVNDKGGQALAKLNMAYAYSDLGETQKAQDLFTETLTLYREQGDKRGEARALTGLGTINSFLGEKQAALDKHLRAMELLRVIGDHAGEAIALNSIGKAYEDLNNLPTALDNYKEALRLYQQLGNVEFESVTHYYIGRTYSSLGDQEAALQFFRASITQSKLAKQQRVMAYSLSAISAIRSKAGATDEALAQLQEALGLYRRIGDRRGQAHALSEIGNIHEALNQNTQALKNHKRALTLYRAAGDRNGEATALYKIAGVERALGDLDGALGHIKESNEVIETLRSQVVSPDLRASYYASVHKHTELYIDLLMRIGRDRGDKLAPESAFEISEHSHSRALLETIGEAAAQIRQGINPLLLEQERALQQKLNAKALSQMRLLADNPEPGSVETVAREIRELTDSYRELQTHIKQQSPRYANLLQPQPLRLKRIQSELTEDTLLLEYALGAERSYLWAVTNDSLTAYELPPRNVIESGVKSVCATLITRLTADQSDLNAYNEQVALADKEYWRQAGQLSEMLLGVVVDKIKGKRILIVPDGALHYLPFQALPEPGENNDQIASQPLIVDHEIVNLPSASILATIRQTPRNGSDENKLVAVLADPVFSPSDPRVNNLPSKPVQPDAPGFSKETLNRLPQTKDEAEAIMAIVPRGAGMMATGFDADRTIAVNGELGQYKIVHFATHGLVDMENPEMSGVMLSVIGSDGKSKEGFFQLHDIYNLNLSNTRLVVLSACQTGLGKEVRGEGLVGLSRGFIYAGASSVVASLWKVDDSATSQLMTEFYRAMFENGLTPSAALRAAQVTIWKQPRHRAPFYWAAFVLQGEYRDAVVIPSATRSSKNKLFVALLIAVTTGLLIFGLVKRKAHPRKT